MSRLSTAWSKLVSLANGSADSGYVGVDEILAETTDDKYWGKVISVYINGSSDFREWVGDFSLRQTKGYQTDFYKSAKDIAEYVIKRFKLRDVNSYLIADIRIVGHSRGGAIGLIAADIIAEQIRDCNIDVITFGAAKAMTRKRAIKQRNNPKINTLTIRTTTDWVPRLSVPLFVRLLSFTRRLVRAKGSYIVYRNVKGKFDHTNYGDAIKSNRRFKESISPYWAKQLNGNLD
jgi:hypothetical protein